MIQISSTSQQALRRSTRILTIPLDSFGLTDYEARSYVALLQSGTLTSSQLARFSQIPRCKAYSVVRNLKSKGLVEIEKGTPLRFRAVPPEEALEPSVLDEEKRVKGMKRVVAKLKHLREETSQPAKVEEGKYLILGSQAVRAILSERISASRGFVHCIVDSWGYRVLEQVTDSIISAMITSEIDFKVILRWEFDLDWTSVKLPANVQLKVGKMTNHPDVNLFDFDDGGVMIVDGKSGSGVFLSIGKLNSVLEEMMFQSLWSSAISFAEFLSIARVRAGEEIFELSNRKRADELFLCAVTNSVQDGDTIARIGESYLQLVGTTINLMEDSEASLALLTTLLIHDLGEGVEVRFDTMTGMLTIDGTSTKIGIPPSPWLFSIIALSKRSGANVKIFPESSLVNGLSQARIVQVKLASLPRVI